MMAEKLQLQLVSMLGLVTFAGVLVCLLMALVTFSKKNRLMYLLGILINILVHFWCIHTVKKLTPADSQERPKPTVRL